MDPIRKAAAAAVGRVINNTGLKNRIDAELPNPLSSSLPLTDDSIAKILYELVAKAEPSMERECARRSDDALLYSQINALAHEYAATYTGKDANAYRLAYNVAAIHLVRKYIRPDQGQVTFSELTTPLYYHKTAESLASIRHQLTKELTALYENPVGSIEYVLKQPGLVSAVRSHLEPSNVSHKMLMFLAICRGCLDVPSADVVMYLKSLDQVIIGAEARLLRKNIELVGGDLLLGSARDVVTLLSPQITLLVEASAKGSAKGSASRGSAKANAEALEKLCDIIRGFPRPTAPKTHDLSAAIFVDLLKAHGQLDELDKKLGEVATLEDADFVKHIAGLVFVFGDAELSLGKAMHYAARLASAARLSESGEIEGWDWRRCTIPADDALLMPFERASFIVRGIAVLQALYNKPKRANRAPRSLPTTGRADNL